MISRIAPIPDDEDRKDFAELRKRAIELTESARRVLWVAIDWHDVTRDEWAAEVIRRTPAGEDPIAAVVKALRAWRDEHDERSRVQEGWSRFNERRDRRAVR